MTQRGAGASEATQLSGLGCRLVPGQDVEQPVGEDTGPPGVGRGAAGVLGCPARLLFQALGTGLCQIERAFCSAPIGPSSLPVCKDLDLGVMRSGVGREVSAEVQRGASPRKAMAVSF